MTFKTLTPLCAAAFLLFSCGGNDSKEWKTENTVVYHCVGEPDNLHPTNGNSSERTEIMLYTQVFLLQTNYPDLNVVCPQLAKTAPQISEDGLNYIYDLRNDMKFDDGSAITTEDVIFSFKAVKCPLVSNPHFKPYVETLKTIKVDSADPAKITLVMKQKYLNNMWFVTDVPILQRKFFDPENVLAKYSFEQLDDTGIVSKNYADLNNWAKNFNDPKYGHDLKNVVGAGPYTVSAWDVGQSLTLTRKKNHWSEGKTGLYELAYPEKIIFKVSKDPSATKVEFKKQNFDASTSLDPKTLLELQEDPEFNKNYESAFTPTFNYSYIAMNMKPDNEHKKLFVDRNVRRAIAHLIPYDDINKVVYKGKNKRMTSPVSPSKAEHNGELKLIEYDIEKAKKMLADAGWKDTDGDNILDKVIDGEKVSFEFKLGYMATTTTWADVAKLIAESFQKAGLKANFNALQYPEQTANARNHNFDMFIGSWGGVSIPEDFTQLWHTSSWTSKGSNYPGFGNAETDALIDSIKYELDETKRNPMVKRLQKIIYDEQPYVFLFATMRRVAIHKRFDNRDMYSERPGILLNRLKLNTSIVKDAAE